MNSTSESIHKISNLPNLSIDGFTSTIRNKICKEFDIINRYFILTHFHSDHYRGITSTWKNGFIYCTPITSRLLQSQIHVSANYIREISMNEAINIQSINGYSANITFIHANHCPGAAMIVLQLLKENIIQKTIIHCGDMRFHQSIIDKSPILSQIRHNIDIVYLDTTYANPKHVFLNQQQAINSITSHIDSFLSQYDIHHSCVLLSAYSIGKEKVVNAVLDHIKNKSNDSKLASVYMDRDKLEIMRCLGDDSIAKINSYEYTLSCEHSLIHICKMNLAGTLFNYFKPNFPNVFHYIQQINKLRVKPIHHVVVFIPTGWADSSNYNRQNAIQSQYDHDNNIHVTIILIPYSEHSNFNELIDFVSYIRPITIIPTVFKNDEEKDSIIRMFSKYMNQEQNIKDFISKLPLKRNSLEINSYVSDKKVDIKENDINDITSNEVDDIDEIYVTNSNENWECTYCTYIHCNEERNTESCVICDNPRQFITNTLKKCKLTKQTSIHKYFMRPIA